MRTVSRHFLAPVCRRIRTFSLCALLSVPSALSAAPFDGFTEFLGQSQSFNATVSASGTFQVSGSGNVSGIPFTIPNQVVPLSLVGGNVPLASAPTGSSNLVFDDNTLIPTSVSNMSLDILNGATWQISFNTININALIFGFIPQVISIDLDASIVGFAFQQDPGLSPTVGNDFDLPGDLSAVVEAAATISAGGFFSENFDLPPTPFDIAGSIPGILGISGANPFFSNFSGSFADLVFPIAVADSISDPEFQINFAVDATVSIGEIGYDLNGPIAGQAIPEPSAVVLAGLIGILGGGYQLRRRRLRKTA